MESGWDVTYFTPSYHTTGDRDLMLQTGQVGEWRMSRRGVDGINWCSCAYPISCVRDQLTVQCMCWLHGHEMHLFLTLFIQYYIVHRDHQLDSLGQYPPVLWNFLGAKHTNMCHHFLTLSTGVQLEPVLEPICWLWLLHQHTRHSQINRQLQMSWWKAMAKVHFYPVVSCTHPCIFFLTYLAKKKITFEWKNHRGWQVFRV